jgi:outer membrane protein
MSASSKAKELLELQVNNEQVLAKQLEATNDRLRVGEITRTDVAQAEAALEGARATRETAEGSLQTARGTFQQIIGVFPPDDLVEPRPLNLPVKSEQEASILAATTPPSLRRCTMTPRPRTPSMSPFRRCCHSSAFRVRRSSRTMRAPAAAT